MIRKKQIFSTGLEVIHFVSAFESDRALCGQDLAGDRIPGDERGSYEEASSTTKKADCEDCITIIEYCKTANRKEWV